MDEEIKVSGETGEITLRSMPEGTGLTEGQLSAFMLFVGGVIGFCAGLIVGVLVV